MQTGVKLIPESEAGAHGLVENWCHRRCVVVARCSEGWGALDEELSGSEWELPSHAPPRQCGAAACFCECDAYHTPAYC